METVRGAGRQRSEKARRGSVERGQKDGDAKPSRCEEIQEPVGRESVVGGQRHEIKKDNRERSIKKNTDVARRGETNTGEVRGCEPDPDLVSAVHRSIAPCEVRRPESCSFQHFLVNIFHPGGGTPTWSTRTLTRSEYLRVFEPGPVC